MNPPCILQIVTRTLVDEAATQALGAQLAINIFRCAFDTNAQTVQGGAIYFSGDLGAGKTTLIRALLRGLGIHGRIKSPTYTLVESYAVPSPRLEFTDRQRLYCHHFDFYRFIDPQEWREAGFHEYFDRHALCLVEWPEKSQSHDGALGLPQPDLHIFLETHAAARRIVLHGLTSRGLQWLENL